MQQKGYTLGIDLYNGLYPRTVVFTRVFSLQNQSRSHFNHGRTDVFHLHLESHATVVAPRVVVPRVSPRHSVPTQELSSAAVGRNPTRPSDTQWSSLFIFRGPPGFSRCHDPQRIHSKRMGSIGFDWVRCRKHDQKPNCPISSTALHFIEVRGFEVKMRTLEVKVPHNRRCCAG